MLRKSSYSLKITLFLSTVILFPLDEVSPMDVPLKEGERVLIKQEPHFEMNRPRKELKRLIPIKRWREIIKKINPTGNRENCIECAIRCYNLIKNQLETAERVGPLKEVAQNMICEDLFATFKRKEDSAKIDSKTVRFNLEDGSTEPVDVTFDAVVFEEEGSYQTLERYLDGIPLKSTSCASSFEFRVGFLYLIHKGADDTGHMINFYCRNSEKKDKYYIIDAQCGSIKTLENFLDEESGEYLNYLYIYYDKGENLPPLEASKNYIKLEDDDSYELEATSSEGLIKPATSEPKLTSKRPRENEKESSDQGSKRHKGNSEAPLLEESTIAIEALIEPNEIGIVTAEIVESEVTTVIEPNKSTKRQRRAKQTPSDQGSKNGPKRRKTNNKIIPSKDGIESEVSVKKTRKKNPKSKDQGSKGQEKKPPRAGSKSNKLGEKFLEEKIHFPKEIFKNQSIDGSPIFDLIAKDNELRQEKCEILSALIYLGCDWVKKPIEQMVLQEQGTSFGKKTLDLVKNFTNQQEAMKKLFEVAGFSIYPNLNKIASSSICTAAVLGYAQWAKDIAFDLAMRDQLNNNHNPSMILLAALDNYNNQKTDLIQKNAQWIKNIFWDRNKSDSDNQKVIEAMTQSCAEAVEDGESLNLILERAKCDSVSVRDTGTMILWLELVILELPIWDCKYTHPNFIFEILNHYKKLKTDLIEYDSQWIGSIIDKTSQSEYYAVKQGAIRSLSSAIIMDFSWAKNQILLMAKSESTNLKETAVRALNSAIEKGSIWAKGIEQASKPPLDLEQKMHSIIETVIKSRQPTTEPLKETIHLNAWPVPQQSVPVSSMRPSSAQKPMMSRGMNPIMSQSTNPMVSQSMNPMVSQGMNPMMSQRMNPMMPQSIIPMVSQGMNPMMPQSINPMVSQGMNPMMPQSINPMVSQGMNPMIPQRMNPMMPQSINLLEQQQQQKIEQQEQMIRELQEEIAKLRGNKEDK